MTTQDGQVKWKIKDGRTHHMCGEIVALVTTPPNYEHLLLCNGQTISADDYPELVAALGTNVLPNLNGRVLQGGKVAGQYKEAGLPNIKGTFDGIMCSSDVRSGCLLKQDYIKGHLNFAAGSYKRDSVQMQFDASKSSSIYGASTTVQPPAYTVRYYICYG